LIAASITSTLDVIRDSIVAQDNERQLGVLPILLVSDALVGSEDGIEAGVLSGF